MHRSRFGGFLLMAGAPIRDTLTSNLDRRTAGGELGFSGPSNLAEWRRFPLSGLTAVPEKGALPQGVRAGPVSRCGLARRMLALVSPAPSVMGAVACSVPNQGLTAGVGGADHQAAPSRRLACRLDRGFGFGSPPSLSPYPQGPMTRYKWWPLAMSWSVCVFCRPRR